LHSRAWINLLEGLIVDGFKGLASGWPLNIVFLHLAVQGAAGDVQLSCCPAYIPVHLFQDRTNEDALCVAERTVE